MSASKFRDCFGRELQTETCAYCGVTRPISHWSGIENGKDSYTILMVEFTARDGNKMWKCRECSTDIENKSHEIN